MTGETRVVDDDDVVVLVVFELSYFGQVHFLTALWVVDCIGYDDPMLSSQGWQKDYIVYSVHQHPHCILYSPMLLTVVFFFTQFQDLFTLGVALVQTVQLLVCCAFIFSISCVCSPQMWRRAKVKVKLFHLALAHKQPAWEETSRVTAVTSDSPPQ